MKPDFSSIVCLKFYYSKLSEIYRSFKQSMFHSFNQQNCFKLYQETIGDLSFFIKRSHIFVISIHRVGNRFRFSSARRIQRLFRCMFRYCHNDSKYINNSWKFHQFVFVRRNNTKLEWEYWLHVFKHRVWDKSFFFYSKEPDFSRK